MASDSQPARGSKILLWLGYIVSTLVVLVLLMSGVMKLLHTEDVVKGFKELQWDDDFALALGILEIGCTVIYAIPRTSVLGGILLTGYFGGALATHVRIYDYDHFVGPIVLGVLAWLGLYLRDARLRALVPLRS